MQLLKILLLTLLAIPAFAQKHTLSLDVGRSRHLLTNSPIGLYEDKVLGGLLQFSPGYQAYIGVDYHYQIVSFSFWENDCDISNSIGANHYGSYPIYHTKGSYSLRNALLLGISPKTNKLRFVVGPSISLLLFDIEYEKFRKWVWGLRSCVQYQIADQLALGLAWNIDINHFIENDDGEFRFRRNALSLNLKYTLSKATIEN